MLSDLIKNTDFKKALLFNNEGVCLDNFNFEHDEAVAAMSNAIHSMTNKFLEDIKKGEAKEILVLTDNNTVILKRIDEDKNLLLSSNKDINLGIALHNAHDIASKI